MARWAYIIAAFGALAAWAGAQGPPPAPALTAADQLRLLKANSTLIDNLVDHGVALSRADKVEERAERCRQAAQVLATAIQDAATKQEPERVVELTELFREIVRDALLPTIEDGKRLLTPGSPGAAQLRKTRDDSARDIRKLKAAIPATGKVGESARVKEALKQLDGLSEELK
ncbi:MAG TPA: hypothetical protein VGE74_30710 [Gemmata sp.]